MNTIEFILEEAKNIETDISKIDNNYFIEHPDVISKFHSLFCSNSLYKLKEQIQNFEDIVNANIINACEHELIDDYIDINCEKSMNITYCKKCETSKK